MNLFQLINEDRITNGYGFTIPGFHVMAIHRFGTWLDGQSRFVRLIAKPFYKVGYVFCRNFYGIEIPKTVKIGRRLLIGHQSGIVIHPHSVIGDDCIIRFNSSLAGAAITQEKWSKEAPCIGNNVTIGVGAVVIGNVKIGDNVRIGPNAVVTTDIPAYSIVVVDKPRIITRVNNG